LGGGESEKNLLLLLLDFEKDFDGIEWVFLLFRL